MTPEHISPDHRLADYALALDIVSRMADLATEDLAIERILDLFVEICAPDTLAYLSMSDGGPGRLYCRPEGSERCGELGERLASLTGDWAWNPSGDGFLLRVRRGGEALGAIEVDGVAFPEHREHYLNLALSMEGVLGLAVSNARNFESLEDARRDLQEERDSLRAYLELSEALNRIDTTLASTLDFDEIIRRVMSEAAQVIGADGVALLELVDGRWTARAAQGEAAKVLLGRTFDIEQLPVSARAARERRTVVCNDLGELARIAPETLRDMRAVLNAPLLAKDELIGVLSFRSAEADAFPDQLVDFVSKVATTVSLAVENARLFEAKRTVADTLQQALLEMPVSVPGVSLAHRYRAATAGPAEVGGDFYEVFALPDGRVATLIGDVSGKGVVAAKTTSLVRDTIRAFAQLPESPAAVVARTNAIVHRQTPADVFATLLFGVLDLETGVYTYCSAGHMPGLLRHPVGEVTALDPTSPLLGSFPDSRFVDAEATMSVADVLVLYTDGAIDARRQGEFFGEERLRRLVASGPADPEDMAEHILSSVEAFAGGVYGDDLALLALKISG